jgi:hypothetical protein
MLKNVPTWESFSLDCLHTWIQQSFGQDLQVDNTELDHHDLEGQVTEFCWILSIIGYNFVIYGYFTKLIL